MGATGCRAPPSAVSTSAWDRPTPPQGVAPGGAGGRGRWVTQSTALPALWLAACRKARPAWARSPCCSDLPFQAADSCLPAPGTGEFRGRSWASGTNLTSAGIPPTRPGMGASGMFCTQGASLSV